MFLFISIAIRGPNGKRTRLHTVAASNNWNRTPCLFYYCLFAPHRMVLFLAHIPFMVNRVCNAAPTEQPQHSAFDEQQDKFIDLQIDSTAKDLSDYNTWHLRNSGYIFIGFHPIITARSLFSLFSTYLCKSDISTMLFIKTTHINRLEAEDDCKMFIVTNNILAEYVV